MKSKILFFLIILFLGLNSANAQANTKIGLYRTFERSLENNNSYSNKFIDVAKCIVVKRSEHWVTHVSGF